MKKKIYAALMMLALSAAAVAQLNLANLKGRATDQEGKPYPVGSVEIRMLEAETGRKYTLKPDKNGYYQSIAIQPGKYKMTLFDTANNREIYNLNNVTVALSIPENVVDFDMKKEASNTAGKPMTAEQKKAMEQMEAAKKENLTVKDLNNLLASARTAKESGDTATAMATIDKAISIDTNRDLLWYTKGDIQLAAAKAETDRAARKDKYTEAIGTFQKAIDLANASTDAKAKTFLGNYYEGLAKAHEGSGDVDKSAAGYDAAAQAWLATGTPEAKKQAASDYFNKGAVYTNSNRSDDALKAFDQALAQDPDKAEAYYWKGIALMGKGETKGNKFVAPEGTAEAFNKYLELRPDGPMAQPAKDMLAAIGSEVQTSFKARKDKKK
jgi:tetratricopeptide (TPR) repeat protein